MADFCRRVVVAEEGCPQAETHQPAGVTRLAIFRDNDESGSAHAARGNTISVVNSAVDTTPAELGVWSQTS
jgi:hypothetical protein